MLRGRDPTVFEIFLMSDLGEAHSKKVIRLCNKYGIVKQATSDCTLQHNAVVERWFQTNGEMSTESNQCGGGVLGERKMTWYVVNQYSTTHTSDSGEPWHSPRQRQYPDHC